MWTFILLALGYAIGDNKELVMHAALYIKIAFVGGGGLYCRVLEVASPVPDGE